MPRAVQCSSSIYLNPDLLNSTNYFALAERWWITKLSANLDSIKKQTSSYLAKATKFAISRSVKSNYLELKWCKKLDSTTKVEQRASKVKTVYNNRSKFPHSNHNKAYMIKHPGQQPQGQNGSQSRDQFLPTAPYTKPATWKGEASWVKMLEACDQ